MDGWFATILIMLRRRIVIFVALAIVALWILAAIQPTERRFGDTPSGAAAQPSGPPRPMVEGTLPSRREVKAQVGDVVRLTVSALASDMVELPDLSLEQPVDPYVPAEMLFVADRSGSFRVRLRESGETIGTLRVLG